MNSSNNKGDGIYKNFNLDLRTIVAKYKLNIALIIIALGYFLFLLRFYLIDYYVPDMGLYFSFSQLGLPTKDGFCSLFLLIASLTAQSPKLVTLSCLVLLAISMFNYSLFFKGLIYSFKTDGAYDLKSKKASSIPCNCKLNIIFAFCILVLYSCCAFYYCYGKIFYDFPFTSFCYSLCLLIALPFWTGGFKSLRESQNANYNHLNRNDQGNDQKEMRDNASIQECSHAQKVPELNKSSLNINSVKQWLWLCTMCGFTLSWKPYNIFAIAGMGLLMLVSTNARSELFRLCHSIKAILLTPVSFLLGYLVGNFNFFLNPKGAIEGIMAYPAKANFSEFLFFKTRVIWDHINDLPFNLSVMNVVTLTIFMLVLPILLKRFWHLLVSLFMLVCLWIFVTRFSPGYAWHGFTFGLFIITFVPCLLFDYLRANKSDKEQQIEELNYHNFNGGGKLRIGIATFALLLQCIMCFLIYMPIQASWHEATQISIKQLEEHEPEIYRDVKSIIERYKAQDQNKQINIEVALKRWHPVPMGLRFRNDFSRQNTYMAPSVYRFVDPLERVNYPDWTNLRILYHSNDPNLVVFIMPDGLKQIPEVAVVNVNVDNFRNLVFKDLIHGEGYSIYLYEKRI